MSPKWGKESGGKGIQEVTPAGGRLRGVDLAGESVDLASTSLNLIFLAGVTGGEK